MKPIADESITTRLTLIGFAVAAAAFTVGGAMTEQAALHNLVSGHVVLGAWEAWMGTLALVIGIYLLGYRELWTRFDRLRQSQ